FPENPTRADIDEELRQVEDGLGGRALEDLIHAPRLSDPRHLVAIRLLMEIFPAAFLSGSGDLFPFLVLKSVNISLAHGNSPEAAFAYAAYGMLLCGALDDPALGYRYGRLAVAMNEMFEDIALKSRVIYLYAMFIHHWSEHWSTLTPWFRKGIEAGYQSGDLLYLAYSAQDCIIWDPTLDLETASKQHRDYLTIVRDCEYQDSLDSGTLFLQMQLNFMGLTDGLCSMNDESFDEERCVAGMRDRKFMTGVANHHIYMTEIAYLYGEHAVALEHVRAMDELIASAMSLPQLVRFRLVAFLTLAAVYPAMTAAERTETDVRFARDLGQMRAWAANCPVNFLHLQQMMEGELIRLHGDVNEAVARFEEAIESAHASGFVRDEAMANELAGRCLLAAGRQKPAEGYIRAAYHLYERWGARRKVAHMEREQASVLFPEGAPLTPDQLAVRSTTSRDLGVASLDMTSVIRASQAISGELIEDQLWGVTLPLLLESAGGQRGCVVVRREGRLVVESQARAPGVTDDRPPFSAEAIAGEVALPLSVVNYVLRTNEPVVVNDINDAGRFARDSYLLRARPQSAVCVPLSRHSRFQGVVYMENNLASGVFTNDRIEVIKLLAAQASISLENAGLYQEQVRLTEAQGRFVPRQFLESLDRPDIAQVGLGDHVAKEMSVLFADLRGFTPIAEQMHPRKLIDLLNRYFASAEPPISAAGGFIDSFRGDEIMALFDAGADNAVEAGIGMTRALDRFNETAVALDDPPLRVGIGVNTGPMLLGTVGVAGRIQCSVVGDTVNAASRIEQLTKSYAARFLIGQRTFERLEHPERFSLRAIDRVAVKGKTQPFDVYEVLDAETAERRAAKEATTTLLSEVVAAYRARAFADALVGARRGREMDPADLVLALYISRCEVFLRSPPPDDWQGVEALG
ncbi:MAG TPA: adenylate/guanylate cyclase domain-containing protein, partial [Acidimicrobiales bacterium]